MSELNASMNGGGMSGAQVQTGTIFTSQENETVTITFGFSPNLVIIYSAKNQDSAVAFYDSGNPSYAYIPRIYVNPGKTLRVPINSYNKPDNSANWIAIKF